MIFEKQATCPFCGQELFVVTTSAKVSDEELVQLASEQCQCDAAIMNRGMTSTEEAIQGVLGEESMNRFEHALPEKTINTIRMICKDILDRRINTVTLKEPNGDVIKLVRNGNAVKIRRTAKRQMEM